MSPVRDNLEPGRHAHPVDQAEAVLWAASVRASADLISQLEAERLRPVPPVDHEPAWMPDLRRLIAVLADLLLNGEQ